MIERKAARPTSFLPPTAGCSRPSLAPAHSPISASPTSSWQRHRELQGRHNLLIYMHDNPDPDAMAAAMGSNIWSRCTTDQRHACAWVASSAAPKTAPWWRSLRDPAGPGRGAEYRPPSTPSPSSTANPAPATTRCRPADQVDVVIDHHPAREESAQVPWRDIRPELGATSTIIVEYLRALNIPLDTPAWPRRCSTPFGPRRATLAARPPSRARGLPVPFPAGGLSPALRASPSPRCRASTSSALDRALRSAQVLGDSWPSTWAASPTLIWWPKSRTCCSRAKARGSFCAAAATAIDSSCRCAPSPASAEPAR